MEFAGGFFELLLGGQAFRACVVALLFGFEVGLSLVGNAEVRG